MLLKLNRVAACRSKRQADPARYGINSEMDAFRLNGFASLQITGTIIKHSRLGARMNGK